MTISKRGSDPSRAERKAKKRKLEDAIPDLPGDEQTQAVALASQPAEHLLKKRKRSTESGVITKNIVVGEEEEEGKLRTQEKKRQQNGDSTTSSEGDIGPNGKSKKMRKHKKKVKHSFSVEDSPVDPAVAIGGTGVPTKSKKERKAERKAREAVEMALRANDALQEDSTSTTVHGRKAAPIIPANPEEKRPRKNNRNREKKRKVALEDGVEAKAPRFIAFIGNLPYSTTTESLQKHFASVKPKSVRHATEKENPGKSKGFAFVEFNGYDHMKTCLKTFHHSMFDDGVSPPRKINVELTAGGGGNTKDRRAKIEGKNQKLNDERVRRIQEEEKVKATKRSSSDEYSIHPSRRGRVVGT